MQDSFYGIINILLLVYACYSWYWQAKLELRGKYRISILIWTLIIIWLGFTWNYFEKSDTGINVFLALLLLISIIDGYTGFASKRIVVSGYFKRTVSYSEVESILLLKVNGLKKPTVACIMGTSKGRQYYLRFDGDVNQVLGVLKKNMDHNVRIEVRELQK